MTTARGPVRDRPPRPAATALWGLRIRRGSRRFALPPAVLRCGTEHQGALTSASEWGTALKSGFERGIAARMALTSASESRAVRRCGTERGAVRTSGTAYEPVLTSTSESARTSGWHSLPDLRIRPRPGWHSLPHLSPGPYADAEVSTSAYADAEVSAGLVRTSRSERRRARLSAETETDPHATSAKQ